MDRDSTLSKFIITLCVALGLAAVYGSVRTSWALPAGALQSGVATSTHTPTATPTQTPGCVPGTIPWLCPRPGYPDYAPNGPPDIDMRQNGWHSTAVSQLSAATWTHSGPSAAADAMWYLDSQAEYYLGHKYPLVTSYGTWGDHDPDNVPPLVNDLTSNVHTSSAGTSVENMAAGLRSYIDRQGVGSDFTIQVVKGPTRAWLSDRAMHNEEIVILLFGFWQQDGGQWTRLGGHWVVVCCIDQVDGSFEAIDPFFDYAAAGYPGRSYGGLPPPASLHNDAAKISYDLYYFLDTTVPGAEWAVLDYAHTGLAEIVGNSMDQNWAADLLQYAGAFTSGRDVVTAADYAVIMRPVTCYPIPAVTATPTATPTVPSPTPRQLFLPLVNRLARHPAVQVLAPLGSRRDKLSR